MLISDFLLTGEKNAQTSRELCDLLHVDLRSLQASVERERRDGIPICATNSGYFLATNKAEMREYCNFLESREISVHITLEACRKTIDKLPDI